MASQLSAPEQTARSDIPRRGIWLHIYSQRNPPHLTPRPSNIIITCVPACSTVSAKALQHMVRDSKAVGKASFAYAWVLDEEDDERARWVVMTA